MRNVYPTGLEEGPRSSALSLLVFYASSKRQKLTKIGLYVEKRVGHDIRHSRFGHVKVSLEIICALLKECHQNTQLVSRSVMRTLILVLKCSDSRVALQATDTFVLFNRYYNHESVVDDELKRLYLALVTEFHAESTKPVHLSRQDHRFDSLHRPRLSGLKALESLCDKDLFLKRPDLGEFIDLMMAAFLYNINDSSLATSDIAPCESSQANSAAESDLTKISMQCISKIFAGASANNMALILAAFYRLPLLTQTMRNQLDMDQPAVCSKTLYEDCRLVQDRISILDHCEYL